jgi:hypothetical protein
MTFTEPPLKAVKESYDKFILLYTPREEILAHALMSTRRSRLLCTHAPAPVLTVAAQHVPRTFYAEPNS